MAVSKVWVFGEVAEGAPTSTTLELLTKARSVGSTVECFLVGDGAAHAGTLGEYGATKVYAYEPGDKLVGPGAAASLAALIEQESPELILFPMDYDGRDVFGRLSVRLDRPVLTNGVGLSVEGDDVRVETAIFGGNTIVTTAFRCPTPLLAGIRAKSFAAEPAGGGAAEVAQAPVVEVGRAGETPVLDRHVEERQGPKLEEAAVVVAGGRGLGAAEHYAMVEEMAKILGGAAGASRAIVDAGWVPYSSQVGQTGKTVKPKVYIALGISGATQHMVGMKGSENIIAVNKDPDAPIFSIADLGIVGDVHKVGPKLLEALRAKS